MVRIAYPILTTTMIFSVSWSQYSVNLPDSIADPGAQVEILATDRSFCEGPAIAGDSALFFTDDAKIFRMRPGGQPTEFVAALGGANGMIMTPDAYLAVCASGDVARVDTGTGDFYSLITNSNGYSPGSCNDLTRASTGEIFFSDPIFGGGTTGNNLYHLSPSGVLTRIGENLHQPNGIEYAEEIHRLYVNMAGDNKIVFYDVAADGSLSNETDFILNVNNPDGIDLDLRGNLYVAEYGSGNVRVFNPGGEDLGFIDVRDGEDFNTTNRDVTNCSFGWGDNTYLYITGNNKVFRVKLKIPGRKGNAITSTRKKQPSMGGASVLSEKYSAKLLPWIPRKSIDVTPVFSASGRTVGAPTPDDGLQILVK